MPLDYKLATAEQFGSIIVIFAYILVILSGQQSKQYILQMGTEQEINSNMPRPELLVSTASWIRIVGVLILALVASVRLSQQKRLLETGEKSGSIIPNINITAGSWGALISYVIETIGAQQKVEEPGTMITFI